MYTFRSTDFLTLLQIEIIGNVLHCVPYLVLHATSVQMSRGIVLSCSGKKLLGSGCDP